MNHSLCYSVSLRMTKTKVQVIDVTRSRCDVTDLLIGVNNDPILFEVLHMAWYIDQWCIVSDVNSLVAIYQQTIGN